MMKISVVSALVLLLLFPATALAKMPVESLTIVTKNGVKHDFTVEIARADEEKERGLMFRMGLPENGGMFFLFDTEGERNFWMKSTYIPLDLLFIKKSGVISHIHENAVPHSLMPLVSNGPVLNVLEISGGAAARLGIKEGDTVHHKTFGNVLAK